MNSIGIGLAGLGTVGSEVARQLLVNKKFLEKKSGASINLIAVSARNKTIDRGVNLKAMDWCDNPEEFLNYKNINLIVELIGGSDGVAYDLCFKSLNNNRSVVTANKAMISKHGMILSELSEKNNLSLAFEASVAGCIPIIRALRDGLSATNVNKISGILNGTCNYILSTMRETERSFEDVLSEAQEKGFAEADPTFDVEGIDAAQKLIILSSIAFGIVLNNKNISTTGIKDVNLIDLVFAEELGYRVKLLAISEFRNSKLIQEVSPCMVSKSNQIANVEGVLNAVEVNTDLTESVVLTGFGAGDKPTASAVLSDIISVAQNKTPFPFGCQTNNLIDGSGVGQKEKSKYYIRINVIDKSGVLAKVAEIFRKSELSIESLLQRGRNPDEDVPIVITTHETDELTLNNVIEDLVKCDELLQKPVKMKII